MQITILSSQFLLVSQWNVDHDTSKMLSLEVPSVSSNFFLRSNFLDRSKIKIPSCERDSFISSVSLMKTNTAKVFSEICSSVLFRIHTSTRMEYQFRERAHLMESADLERCL